jgi:hypothetical protein
MAAITYSNQEINRFWLNILADNCLILYNAFSPANTKQAQEAFDLASKLDRLSAKADQTLTVDQLAQLNTEAYNAAQNYRIFLLKLSDTLLIKAIHFDMKPEMVSDMINMSEYYLYLLSAFMQGQQPKFRDILEDVFWISMFTMQSKYIIDNMGPHESRYKKAAEGFESAFTEEWIGAMELQRFSRIGQTNYPVVGEHRKYLQETMTKYYEFLSKLIELQDEHRMISSLSPLFMDRSRRLACFFLTDLSILNNTKKPLCDLFAKRKSVF